MYFGCTVADIVLAASPVECWSLSGWFSANKALVNDGLVV
jgi:hypothetical protein